MVGGGDMTSTEIPSTLLAVILDPRVYQSLKKEIRNAIQQRLVSNPIREFEAKRLRYLQACTLKVYASFLHWVGSVSGWYSLEATWFEAITSLEAHILALILGALDSIKSMETTPTSFGLSGAQ